jgi:hypothetical protein
MSPYILLAALLAVVVATGSAYIKGRSDGEDLEAGRRDAETLKLAQVEKAAQRGAAEAISKIEVQNVTVRQQLQTKIQERVVYRDCRHDDDSLRVLNAAITGRDQPASDSKLPGANPAH